MRKQTFPILVLALSLCACSSPLDIDTPRDRIIEEELQHDTANTRIKATSIQIFYHDDFRTAPLQTDTTLLLNIESLGIIDTLEERLWLQGTWETDIESKTATIPHWQGLRSLSMHLDSIDLAHGSYQAMNTSSTDSVAITYKHIVERTFHPNGISGGYSQFSNGHSLPFNFDQFILGGFTHNRAKRQILIEIRVVISPIFTETFTAHIEIEY